MRNTNIIILMLALLTLVVSCKKDKDVFDSTLLVGTAYIEVSNKAQRGTFDVLSNRPIEVSTDVGWITLDSTAYNKGKHKVGFETSINDDEERSATIVVRIGNEQQQEVLVVQETGKAPVFYVKPGGTGDGKSWANAIDLTTALEQATTNSTLHLAAGVYYPTKVIRNGDANNEADKTIEISKNLKLIGGYEENPTVSSQANPTVNKTIFDGQISAQTQAYHTVTITAPYDLESKVSLNGIIIRGGNATNRGSQVTIGDTRYNRGWGGGLLIANARVELRNIEVVDNKTSNSGGTVGYGAGVYAFGNAKIEMFDSKINDNKGGNNGGGFWLADGDLIAYNSTFNGNHASGTAAGLHGYPNANITLYNCEIKNNTNTSYGAGLYVRENSNAIIVNTLITGNKSTSSNGGGGVMQYGGTSVFLISSTVTNNSSSGPGGGMYRRNLTNNLSILNSIVALNTQVSSSKDIDIYTEASATSPSIKNSVITGAYYTDNGNIDTDKVFTPSTMLDGVYMPIGINNPALTGGVSQVSLSTYGNSFTPALSDLITKDKFGNDRSAPVMGYKVK